MIDTTERVFSLASAANISMIMLSQISGVSRSTFTTAKARQTQLSVDSIQQVCNALNISVSDFFNENLSAYDLIGKPGWSYE